MKIQDCNQPVVENVLRIINAKGLKQCYVSETIGCSPQDFSNMLNGRKTIKIADVIKLTSALGVTPNDLFSTDSEHIQ